MKVCIVCQKDVEGRKAVRVKEDRIIQTIRKVKQALKIAQNNELYVCEEDIKTHQERRRGYERNVLLAAVLAGIIIVLLIFTLIVSGKFNPWTFLAGIVLCLVILAFPFFRYSPALEGMPVKAFGKQAAQPTPMSAVSNPGTAEAGGAKAAAAPVMKQKKTRARKKEVS